MDWPKFFFAGVSSRRNKCGFQVMNWTGSSLDNASWSGVTSASTFMLAEVCTALVFGNLEGKRDYWCDILEVLQYWWDVYWYAHASILIPQMYQVSTKAFKIRTPHHDNRIHTGAIDEEEAIGENTKFAWLPALDGNFIEWFSAY